MSKIRIYQLAKQLNVQNKDLIDKLHQMGHGAHTHMDGLEDDWVDKLTKTFNATPVTNTAANTEAPQATTTATAPKATKEKEAHKPHKAKEVAVQTEAATPVAADSTATAPKSAEVVKTAEAPAATAAPASTTAAPIAAATTAAPAPKMQAYHAGGTTTSHKPSPAKPHQATGSTGAPKPQGSSSAGAHKPQGTGHTGAPKPQGTGHTGAPKPQGTGHTGAPRPQGSGNTGAPRPQGSGNTGAPRPQGSGNTGAPRPQGSGNTGAPRPQGSGNTGAPRPQQGAGGQRPSSGPGGQRPAQGGGQRPPANQAGTNAQRPQANKSGGVPLTMQRTTKKFRQGKRRDKEDEVIEVAVEETKIFIPERMTVGDFAIAIDKTNNEVILKLMNLGIMAAINHFVAYPVLEKIANDFDIEIEPAPVVVDEDILEYDFEDESVDQVKRAPVVTVMGHVDHGKTSLLDAIRSTSVTDKEAGGITQHIGASEVYINGEKIVFLDTPGHEAFTSLRARGAQVTDIAILVVAADDGVKPQTIEAIDHARAANVPIIIAINKMDKVGANPERVKQELSELGLLVEDWGGEIVSVPVSALKGENIDTLLEMVLLVSEMLELKANPDRNAVGTVIEANLDIQRGAVATVLIQNGSLQVGDPFVCGTTAGRVRALFSDKGKKIKKAGPSTAVEIIGMSEVAKAGDKFFVIDSDKEARKIAEKRALQAKADIMNRAERHVTLEDIFEQIQAGKVKELNLIIKSDVHGSLEAIKQSLAKLNTAEVKVNIQHANIGAITESDIMLATASNTIVIGFNVRPSAMVLSMAKNEGIEIKTYRIIYELINDVESAMKGMLDPEFEEKSLGEVQVRATFKVPGAGTIAGAYVTSGTVTRNASVRLLREGVIIHDGKLSSLKRFKDDVKEVAKGYECGIGIEGYNDIRENDIIEAYIMVEKPRK